MEVTVQSVLQNEAQGRVILQCDPDETIDNLISSFCVQKGVRQKKDYILRDKNNEILHSSRKIGTCGVNDGDILYLCSPASDETTFGCSNWWILAGVCLLIGSVGLIAISVLKVVGDEKVFEYGIVIDAGSSHSSLYLYKWEGEKDNGTGAVQQISTCQSKGGPLSDFDKNPKEAGDSLRPCLDKVQGGVPSNLHPKTPIYLGATAGMRMLNDRDEKASNIIMESVRTTLKSYPFKFDHPEVQAKILTGKEEGSYSWVTVNYIGGSFGHLSKATSVERAAATLEKTVGALDLGGASTQITFVPKGDLVAPKSYLQNMVMFGYQYQIYTDSFLCYGKSEAERRLLALLVNDQGFNTSMIVNPCGPRGNITEFSYDHIFEAPCTKGPHARSSFGFDIIAKNFPSNTTFRFFGSSNSSGCSAVTAKMFNFTTCDYGKNCSFNNHYFPGVNGNFLAFSGFFYTMDFYNFTHEKHPQKESLDVYKKEVEWLCGLDWAEIEQMEHKIYQALPFYCFDGHFIVNLLANGYGFTGEKWRSLTFKQKVGNTKIGWSLGYMLNETNSIPPMSNQNAISLPLFICLTILFIIFICIAIAFACFAKKFHDEDQSRKSKYAAENNVA